jgi:hypothetical protein
MAYPLFDGPTRTANLSDKTRVSRERLHGHAGSVWRQAGGKRFAEHPEFKTSQGSRMNEATVLGMSTQAWVVWACAMALWTMVQGLLNLPRTDPR